MVKRPEGANPGELISDMHGELSKIAKAAAEEQFRRVTILADNLRHVCDAIGTSREMLMAKTKIDEAVMWAEKHTREF